MAVESLSAAWDSPGFHWNAATATHLLNRAGFGGNPRDIAELAALGPGAAVQRLVYYHNQPEGDLKPLDFGPLTHMQPRQLRRYRMALRRYPPLQRKAAMQLLFGARNAKLEEMRYWWLDRMVRTRRPLQEKMTLLWHGLFVSAFPFVRDVYHLYMQNQLFRRMATGNIKTLTLEVSKDPAMLQYLNNNVNKKQHPNENFARELMELFTLGIGNYTEEDVRQSARAWTGWTFFGDRFIKRPRWHDFGVKTFLGHTGNWDGTDIIDIIFRQKAASLHFADRFLRFFAVDDPPPPVVEDLAQTLRDHDFDAAPALERLFSSRWFYSDQVMRKQVKSPVQVIVQALRQLDAPLPNINFLAATARLMGQELFQAPTVKGWPFGKQWINTSTLFVRYNLSASLVTGWLSPQAKRLVQGTHEEEKLAEFTSGWDAQYLLARHNARTTTEVVDLLLERLVQAPVRPEKRRDLVCFFNGTTHGKPRSHAALRIDPTNRNVQNQVRNLVHLVMSMPEYQLC